jgi:hypothetical protein
MSNYIPRRDADFHDWQNTLMHNIADNYVQWNIPAVQWTALTALQTKFNDTYSLSVDKVTRTSVTVYAKTNARERFEAALRIFLKAYISYNPLVPYTAKLAMALPVHSKKSNPVPIPSTIPLALAETSSPGVVRIHFRNSVNRRKVKPFGVHGTEIKWAILDSPPINWTELVNSVFETHTPCALSFEGAQRGKHIYFALRWENTRGEKGPCSDIMSAIIA